ncbi:HpcH/HpaI aldolase family protein [Ottowia thiooxydans]|uniref:2-keto-3-deoxy-L-rhamnonate aldolase RhmA n=1 Tax=Ottowia thiooxydans TaxID=219182 RepID=A0ABV2QB43_9BURK
MIRVNKVKQAANHRTKVYGFVLSWPAPQMVEILGTLGMDYVQIDGEHGLFSLEDVENTCRAAELYGMTPIARIPNINSSTILQYIDRGVKGIIAPHISNAEQARQVVDAAYFGPIGDRSLGSARGAGFQLWEEDGREYYAESNKQMMVGVMIEDREGMDKIDEIMAVPGVDFLYIGMNDFSQGLGYPGEPDHPEVLKARQYLFDRVHAANKLMREDIVVEISSAKLVAAGAKKVLEAKAKDLAARAAEQPAVAEVN